MIKTVKRSKENIKDIKKKIRIKKATTTEL